MSSFVVDKVKRILEDNNINYDLSEHEPVYTSEQAAQARGVDTSTGVKALVLKTHEDDFILVLVRADKRADLKKIAKLEKTKSLRLAPPEEVLKVTGCEIGGVPPFGHANNLKTYFDREILENEYVNFNAGLHTVSVRMKPEDLANIIDVIYY